ncbi:MAG: sensory box histidine kinase/response [Prolixibacteraceae bacterium]|nr:MAG: sensory box histidine kinase/response [Prolixibacteraceae bacterium]
MNILLVEDNLMNQKVVMFNLKQLNCKITPVANGRKAFETFKKGSYDLILMDIMLPEMNGYEITAEIRKFEKINNIEKPVIIIAVTANTYENDKEKCLAVGMDEYISKPFSAQQLISTVEKYIQLG